VAACAGITKGPIGTAAGRIPSNSTVRRMRGVFRRARTLKVYYRRGFRARKRAEAGKSVMLG